MERNLSSLVIKFIEIQKPRRIIRRRKDGKVEAGKEVTSDWKERAVRRKEGRKTQKYI